MKNKIFLFVLISFTFVVCSQSIMAYYTYGDVLVVANNASDISLNITDYFTTQRSISHIVYLDVSTAETITFSAFNTSIRQPIEHYITTNNLENIINYIVTTKGVPLRISGTSEDCSGFKSATQASVDSELTLILGSYNGSIGSLGLVYNPYYGKNERFNHTGYGIYLVTRLTGYQNDTDSDGIPDDVKVLIDGADNTNTNGTFVLDQDLAWGSVGNLNNELSSANTTLANNDLNVTFNTNSTFLVNQTNVMGYASWGSNDHYDHLYTANAILNNIWLNGSIAETFVSTSGRTFTSPATYGQSLIADLVHEGCTGAKGYVYEPCASAMTNVDILFGRYTDGLNLADSFYMASPYLSWMDVIVGDPKTIPFKETSPPLITLDYPIDGAKISNGTFINLTVFDNEVISSVWYNNGTGNTTITSPYFINTTDWDAGTYNIIVYAKDTANNLNSKSYQFIINSTTGEYPSYLSFDGDTTDFKILEDRTDVSNAILEKKGFGKIKFLENINVSGLDIDQYTNFFENFVEVNSVNLPNLNKSSNLTIYNLSYVHPPVILKDNEICSVPFCEILSYSGGNLTFNVTSFSSYTSCANSNLTIWDETDANMPFAGLSKRVDEQVKFFANYTNTTSRDPITGANCTIEFGGSSVNMIYNSSDFFYEYNRTFNSSDIDSFNITCNKTNFEELTATDDFIIGCTPPTVGNWLVNQTCNIVDKNHTVNGNLTVGSAGFLNLTGTTNIIFNGSNKYIYINVGGEINVYNTAGFNK